MNRCLIAVMMAMALLAAAASAATNEPVTNSTPPDTVKILESIRAKYNLPALAVVVVKDGKICDRAAVGIRKIGDTTPVTTNDEFHIGSCTKSMTATLAGMFIDEGKLRWDTTIVEVFPELKGKMDKQYEGVTLEQLLQHRGGVPADPPADAWVRATFGQGTPEQQRLDFITNVLAHPPAAPPGTKMIYSNQGYAIVGAMLERIGGKPWETLITEKLFQPLHMDSAGFGPPGTPGKVDEPWGHTRGLLGTISLQQDNPVAIAPAARVHCSLDDLARYAIFHMQGDSKLMKPETLKKLHTPPEGGEYACGWICVKRGWAGGTALFHNGSNTMWYLVMWLAPAKDFAVIVGTNTGQDNAPQAYNDAVSAMILKWLPN